MHYEYDTGILEGFKTLEKIQFDKQTFYINVYAVNCPGFWSRKYEIKVMPSGSELKFAFTKLLLENDADVNVHEACKLRQSVAGIYTLIRKYVIQKLKNEEDVGKQLLSTSAAEASNHFGEDLFNDDNFINIDSASTDGNTVLTIDNEASLVIDDALTASVLNQRGSSEVSDLTSQIAAKSMIDWLSDKVSKDAGLNKTRFVVLSECNADGYMQNDVRAVVLEKYQEIVTEPPNVFGFYLLGIRERGRNLLGKRENHTVLVAIHSSGVRVFNTRKTTADSGGFKTIYYGQQSLLDRNNCSRYAAYLAFEFIGLVSSDDNCTLDKLAKIAQQMSCDKPKLHNFCSSNLKAPDTSDSNIELQEVCDLSFEQQNSSNSSIELLDFCVSIPELKEVNKL